MLARALFLALIGLYSRAETTRITLLVTTDLHGYIYPYDYFTSRPADRGLARIATLVRAERKRNPNSLLVDCGDTIQGSPLEGVYQYAVRTGRLPLGLKGEIPRGDPMMRAMNELGYDAMTVGNHEYNFGLANLARARNDAKFPWISANTIVPASGAVKPFDPYIVKTIGGVKIGIIGITTPAVPSWEKPENFAGLRFVQGQTAVESALADLKRKHDPDLVVVAAHAGLDRDLKTGEIRSGETGHENPVHQIAARLSGIDAIVYGHTHQQLADARINGVLLHQPRNWGISLGVVDFDLEKQGQRWRVANKSARLVPVTKEVETDPAIVAIAKPYHELAEQYLNTPVAESPAELSASTGRIADHAMVDAVHQVQLHYTKADVSLTALFNPGARFPKGPVTVRQVAALYVYDNELYAIEGNGRMLREALENAARYYLSCPDPSCSQGPLINSKIIGYNYDMAQGVDYEIDLTRPEGQRIRNLRFRGKPLDDAQPLRIAINNYRAGGSAGYSMFRGARVLWKSGEEIRNLIVEYYTQRKRLPGAPDHNWRVVPDAARRVLEAEAAADGSRPRTQ